MNLQLSDYYMKAHIYEPPQFIEREFAVIIGDVMMRHLAFSNVQKLRAFLIENAPNHVYFSVAKYEYPELKPMDAKKKYWLGSDLIFDIDFDKLKIPTLDEARKQTKKLVRILRNDFGFNDLTTVFSGSRGYHVHVRDPCIQKLDNTSRREIADYFCEFMPGSDKDKKTGAKKEPKKNSKYVRIDTPVTCDMTRLIRLPGSLHGGSMKRCEVIG